MRFLPVLIFALALFADPVQAAAQAQPAQAKESAKPEIPGPLRVLRSPIVLNYGSFPQLAVTFNHTSHSAINCVLCHHKAESWKTRYADCTTAGCHNVKGSRERGVHSVFMAYHDPASDRSCYGCHKREAKRYPQFFGCRPCHTSP